MISLADPFGGGRAASLATNASGDLALTFNDVPPAAVPVMRALLAVSYTLARVERLALCAIVRRNSPDRVVPLLERHKLLLETQQALASTFVSLLQEGDAGEGDQSG